MISLIVAALLLSIDSVVVSFALGTCRIERRHRHRLVVAFGVCDAAASLVAMSVGFSAAGQLVFFGQWGAPALLVVYAVITFALSWLGQGTVQTGTRRGKALLYLIPIAMGLDNLAASSELIGGAAVLPCAIVIGLVSGIGSICGFRAGEVVSKVAHRLGGNSKLVWAGQYLDGIVLLLAAVLVAI